MGGAKLAGPSLCMVGVNHDTAPLAVRESLSISRGRVRGVLNRLRDFVPYGVILATCNRTEIYAAGGDCRSASDAIVAFLRERSGLPEEELSPCLNVAVGYEAMRHIAETASGLRSMIVGEWEILGQVRQALEDAEHERMVNPPLRQLFRHAIRVGRRVRDETDISRNALSVSSVAVDLAARAVGDIGQRRAVLIGAGQAGKLAARAFVQRGVSRLSVVNRSHDSAEELASSLGGAAVALDDLQSEMESADILISCTGAPHPIVHCDIVSDVMAKRQERPLVVVDIAVPRDVEEAVGRIENVYLYDIDDFTQMSKANRRAREREIAKAMSIVDEEMERFIERWRALDVKPVVGELMRMAEEVRRRQLRLTLKKLPPLSDEERDSLEAMTKAIVNKILHNPIRCLKNNGHGDGELVETVKDLFGIDGQEAEERW
ncbi:MAG: glutamyl-tRNA reductase [Chloroflexota bacterium]|nr:glutamyl-tRNA reductase [Chloroflexota bacterium]